MDVALRSLQEYAEAALDLKRSDRVHELNAAIAGGSLALLKARQASVDAAMQTEAARDTTARMRSGLDNDSLALDNLAYERQYYEKEAAACHAFASAVLDTALGTLDDAPSTAAASDMGPHLRELARLNHELAQRRALRDELQALQVQRAAASTELSNASVRIDDLRTHIEAISSSSKTLMETSLPDTTAVRTHREAAELLPLPLYVLYSQAAVGRSVLGLPLRAEIDGSIVAAARLAAEPTATVQANASGANAPAPPTGAGGRAGKRRHGTQRDDDDDATYKVCAAVGGCPDVAWASAG